ncbi:MAG: hypothetical protein WBP29_08240 [Candidatus Zixiibacteriota bacterium]
MKTAKWTFNINSQFEFAAFYVSLIDYWLSPSVNRNEAKSALYHMARQNRAGRQILAKCLPHLMREIRTLSTSQNVPKVRAMAELYNEVERLTKSRSIPKVYVSLPNRGGFRSTTKSPLREVGAPSSHDRRHVIADSFSKRFVQSLLNDLPDGETQCEYLREVGCDPDNCGGSIQQAARKWQLNMFNHLDNLFMGPGQENRTLGARGINIDPAPWQSGIYDIIRRDLSDILGTRRRLNSNIALDIEQQAVLSLMKERVR